MTTTSSDTTSSAHSGKDDITPTCAIAFSDAKSTAVQRAQPLPENSPPAVRSITDPRTSWAQPHAVKSAISTPAPPTWTTSSLRIAAKPQIMLKNPAMDRMMPANWIQPLATYSSAATDVGRGVVLVAMTSLSVDGVPTLRPPTRAGQ